jgi:hypothetical protein
VLGNVDRDAIERSIGLISARTAADVFLHLALDPRNAIISPWISICVYIEASGGILKVFKCLIARMSKQLMCSHRGDSLRRLLPARFHGHPEKLVARRAISLLRIQQPVTMNVVKVGYNTGDPLFVEDVAP